MAAHNGYLPVSQDIENDGVTQRTQPSAPHTPYNWWAAKKAQVAGFVSSNAGLLLVICAQLFFASMGLSVKLLENLDPPTPTLELITVRMAITVCCCMVYMVANKIPDPILGPKEVRGLLVVRGFAGFFALFGMYYSLNYLSLADSTAITFLGPFTTALAGCLILKETYTKREALAGVFSLLGVILIARPPFLFGDSAAGGGDASDITPFERLRAIGAALIGVGGGTVTYITMRAIGKRAHPMHVISFFSFWCVIVGCIAMVIVRQAVVFPMTWQWITLLLVIGLLGVIAQILMFVGLQYETATRGSLGSYSQLMFAVALEFFVFGTVPSLASAAGAAIILTAQAYAVFSKPKQPDKDHVVLSPLSPRDPEEGLITRETS